MPWVSYPFLKLSKSDISENVERDLISYVALVGRLGVADDAAGQLTRALGTLQRAGENLGETHAPRNRLEAARIASTRSVRVKSMTLWLT